MPVAENSFFVAGHYTATWNSTDIGTTEDGFTINPSSFREPIKIDDYGDAEVNAIFRGININLTFELVQFGSTGAALLTDAIWGDTPGTINDVGQTYVTARAKELILTPVSGINSNNRVYTFPIVVPNQSHGGFKLNTKNRRLRADLMVYPNISTGLVFTRT
jgi:hypothetical protein